MNGGVSCAQFGCDVDERYTFKGCTDVMQAAKNMWHLVVDLSCCCDVLVVSCANTGGHVREHTAQIR